MLAHRSRRRRRLALLLAALFLASAASVLWVGRRLSAGPRYDVVSIATLPDYQDPQLLQQA
jgi:hypothetical protein